MIKLIRALLEIKDRDRIPPLPRGLYSSEYETFTDEQRRVLARYGARDPLGIRYAMKRHNAQTVQELISKLEHYKPRRNPVERARRFIARLYGGYDYNPHKSAIIRATRPRNRRERQTLERLKHWQSDDSS